MSRFCGACLGLLAFAVTIFRGLGAGNSFETIVLRSLWAMVAFAVFGAAIGWVTQKVLDEYALQRNREIFGESPLPEPSESGPAEPSESPIPENASPTGG